MRRLLLLLIIAGLAFLAYRVWQESPVAPPVVEAVPVPTPIPTPEPTPETEKGPRLALEGVVFVVKRFSEPSAGGVRGFSEGMEVRLLRQEAGYFVVTDGEVEARRPRSWFTRDIDLAEDLQNKRISSQADIERRLEQERQAHELRAKENAARWESALAAVEARRNQSRTVAAQSATDRPGLSPLRIGAWNIEFLGNRTDPPRTAADMKAIADFIRGLGVQVLGVCEINGAGPLKDLCRLLGPQWKFAAGTSGVLGSEGQITPGVLWDDSRVEMLGAGELASLREGTPSGALFHREPVTVSFRDRAGGPDFRVIMVHLKAGRTPEDFDRRGGELKALRAYLERLTDDSKEDKDVVVFGDFNQDVSSPESAILEEGAFSRYLTKPGAGRSIIHFDKQIDNIVPLGTFGEVNERSFEIHNKEGLRNPEAWRRTYSDHFAVTVDLEAVPDDDPGARLSDQGRRLR